MMYKSQYRKIDPYDWFCGPGSQIVIILIADLENALSRQAQSMLHFETMPCLRKVHEPAVS